MKENEMSEERQDLNEEEQMTLAVDWFVAMWDEALARGVSQDAMGMIVLSAVTNKLVNIFGQEGAEALLQRTADNIKSGQFEAEDNGDKPAN